LGKTPIADRLLNEEQLSEEEPVFPLEVAFCSNCGMVQILETIAPEILFSADYPYFSSFSDYLLVHSRENVLDIIERRKLNSDSLVVELASNDGYLLKNYVEKGIPVQGIDPADGPANAAEKAGVPTLNTFFTLDLAKQLKSEGMEADVIHANNVLAHVADTNGFVEGISTILASDGVAVIEAPYCKELIDHLEFDTIYHQHLLYLTVTALDYLFRSHNLYINEIKQLALHGGSLRLYIEKHENVGKSVTDLLEIEKKEGIDSLSYYMDFSHRVNEFKLSLQTLLSDLKSAGKSIAGYGAAAKGCTMINYVGINEDTIDFIADRNHHKQGLYMSGTRIPIVDPARILETMPDYVLIFPWNVSEEILKQQAEYRERGGKFIIPIPEPTIV
jgi:2-polyprenyl-3-methyl-5-hydroxy-6-metoxy-1,4-benzoquinol methylase